MRPAFIIIMIIPAILTTLPAHAATQQYLDADTDTPSTTAVDLAPGEYAKFSLPYEVHWTWHGDTIEKDGELAFDVAEGHVHVGMAVWEDSGMDTLFLVVYVNGETEYSAPLARQPGKCLFGCDSQGGATIEVMVGCDGRLSIVYGGQTVWTGTAGTDHALTILKDNDAKLQAHGSWQHCGDDSRPPDYTIYGELPRDNLLLYAAIGLAVAVAVLGAIFALSRGG